MISDLSRRRGGIPWWALAVASLKETRGVLWRFDSLYSCYITQGGAGGALAGCYEPTAQVLLYSYTPSFISQHPQIGLHPCALTICLTRCLTRCLCIRSTDLRRVQGTKNETWAPLRGPRPSPRHPSAPAPLPVVNSKSLQAN
jgi:hypothetical protein